MHPTIIVADECWRWWVAGPGSEVELGSFRRVRLTFAVFAQLADPVVECVGDIHDASSRISGDPGRRVQPGARAKAILKASATVRPFEGNQNETRNECG